jgi:SpoIID/LytB domain protein
VQISAQFLASRSARSPQPRRSRACRVTRLAIIVGAAAILAGLVFAPAASAATGDFIITGRGNGQGQGMSQWGMWEGAREGNTYKQVLAFYYPGTTLMQLSSVAPDREIVTVRITTSVDTFTNVQLTASATSAKLLDSAGVTIQTLAAGSSVTVVYNGGSVQVSGAAATYSYVDLVPDSSSGRVTVKPSDGLWANGARQYWGTTRILPDSTTGKVKIHNILPIEKYVAGVSEISPSWAVSTNTSYYAPDAVKAQSVAARSYMAARGTSIPYDDSRAMNYVGYNVEVSYPYLTQAAQETAGEVITYNSKLISTHFSSSSGGYTTNSAWSDTTQYAWEPAQPDPWSLKAPPTNPGYAWTVTISPSTLTADLPSTVRAKVGTVTQVDIKSRDNSDPTSHVRWLTITGSAGTADVAARDFEDYLDLQSTLILSITKDGSLNRYQQDNTNLAYTGTWTKDEPASLASGGTFCYANTDGASCTVSFSGTYLAWVGKTKSTYGIAKLTLDGVDAGTVDLYSATETYKKVWDTSTLTDGTHTLTIAWTGTKNSKATNYNIAVDAFDTDGTLVKATAPPILTTYQQADSHLFYLGTWTVQSATAASGGSFRYIDTDGSCTVTFAGTSLAWYGKTKSSYGMAKLTLDGVDKGNLDLYSATETYGKVWETGTLSAGTHTLTIAYSGLKNAKASDYNIAVDAFKIMGTIAQAPPRYEQDNAALTYAGSWSDFTKSTASGGSYARACTSGASVTIKFTGTYLNWITTIGTTLGKALVSVDGGTAKSVNLAASSAKDLQSVWNTGLLKFGAHTVKISWDPSNTAGKYISIDAIGVVGSL